MSQSEKAQVVCRLTANESRFLKPAAWGQWRPGRSAPRSLGPQLLWFLLLIAGSLTAQAGITNVVLDLNATSSQWIFPARIQMPLGDALTYLQWLGQYGINERGGPVFSSTVDRDATFFHGGRVVGFPLPTASARPKSYFADDYSSFVARKQNAQGWCRQWMCFSINARASGSPPLDWYYQIRYFSGDPFSNQPPALEIGLIPNSGNYLKDENLPATSPVRFEQSGLELRKVELIQSVQDWSNSIPLIQNKQTYVRVHFLNRTMSDLQVSGLSLRCFYEQGGLWIPWTNTLPADKPTLTVKANTTVNGQTSRTNWNDALNFKLEYPMTTKQLMIQLRGAGLDCEPAVFIDFQPVADLNWHFVLCGYSIALPNNPGTFDYILPSPSEAQILLQRLRAMFPLPDNPEALHPPRFHYLDIPQNPVNCLLSRCFLRDSWASIHSKIAKLNDCSSGGTDIWFGLVSKDGRDTFWDSEPRHVAGQARTIPDCIAASFVDTRVEVMEAYAQDSAEIFAHEMGHLLGRPHTTVGGYVGSCGEWGSITPFFPSEVFPYYYTGPENLNWPFLGPLSQGSYPPDANADCLIIGLDTSGRSPKLLRLTHAAELMSYIENCSTRIPDKWLSKQNYLSVLANLKQRQSQALVSAPPRLTPVPTEVLLVAGVVDLFETNSYFLPIESSLISPPLPAYTPGDYAIRLLTAAGVTLSETPFAVALPPIEYPATNYPGATFALALPAIASVSEVELLHNGEVITRRIASSHAPTVQLLSPNGGEIISTDAMTVQWVASDGNGDELMYRVECSFNGGADWQVVASAWSSNSFSIPRSLTTGTTQALCRVTVTDGFHSQSDVSDQPFTILNNRPVIAIESPLPNSTFAVDQSFELVASALDPEDGYLSATNILWRSSLDGNLGTGNLVPITSGRLSVGQHTISAVAIDRTGLSQTGVLSLIISVPCSYSIGATNRSVPAAGEMFTVAVTAPASCPWTVSNGVPWIQLVTAANGVVGTGAVSCAVQANTNGTPRFASLLIAGKLFTLTQSAALLPSGYPTSWVSHSMIIVSNSADRATKVIRDPAGDLIVIGSTDNQMTGPDMLTIKYSRVDGSVLWQQRYNGPGNGADYARAVAVDSNGNVFVAGESTGSAGAYNDYYTVKYAGANGQILWEKRYNGTGSRNDRAVALIVDTNGDVVVTGWSERASFNFDYYTAKYSGTNGALLWEQRYNGPANRDDLANAMASDSNGDVIVTGSSTGTTNTDGYTVKYAQATGAVIWERRTNSNVAAAIAVDLMGNVIITGSTPASDFYTTKYAAADGAPLWQRVYNGPANQTDYGTAVGVDASGDVFVTGTSRNSNGDDDYYTAKYASSDGRLIWERRYNGNASRFDNPAALTVDARGDVIVTGTSLVDAGNYDCYSVKYASTNGSGLWSRHFAGPADSDDAGVAVTSDNDGNFIVCGTSKNDIFTVKYAVTNGSELWVARYNGPIASEGQSAAIAVDSVGNVVVVGVAWSQTDYYTAKYAPDGTLLWEKQFNGAANRSDRATAVAIAPNGDVIVTGDAINETRFFKPDYDTIRYSAADGQVLWERRVNIEDSELAVAVAVDSNGNALVTGRYYDPRTSFRTYNYYTLKYSPDGSVLWVQVYNGPANGDDNPSAIAVDANGNAIVTGSSASTSGSFSSFFDLYTAKYASTNGAILWSRRYNGPANGSDTGRAVCVDPSGNVVVIGTSANGTNGDFYTAKYAAADGGMLWEKRYNGPANRDDTAQSIAVDSSGNVAVAGTSHNGTNNDYYVAKYASADGSILWEKRYNGPANGDDYASAVAVDSSGNVVVTGTSYNGTNDQFFTAKYSSVSGQVLWEKRHHGRANRNVGTMGLALGPEGMVAVVGTSLNANSRNEITTIVYREDLPAISLMPIPGGLHLRFTGFPGRSYRIERSANVTGPWQVLASPTAPVSGVIGYTDDHLLPVSAFYRISAF